MPKDEFDFDDPMELNGVGFLTSEDTAQAMTECFIEEFMRMGYNHKQILALFRNPHYTGMNMVLQNRGEPFIKQFISATFAAWGRPITWSSTERLASHPPAPTPVSLPSLDDAAANRAVCPSADPGVNPRSAAPAAPHPISAMTARDDVDLSASDPMGAAIPKLNL